MPAAAARRLTTHRAQRAVKPRPASSFRLPAIAWNNGGGRSALSLSVNSEVEELASLSIYCQHQLGVTHNICEIDVPAVLTGL